MTHMLRWPMFGRPHVGARGRTPDGALEAPQRPGVVVLAALGAVALTSLVLHLWGIAGDLPYAPDVDEPVFLEAAVRMLQHATLNPGWFGHPGSTIIYPTAAIIELWYLGAQYVSPFAHPIAGIEREFIANPMPFYLIGRLVSVVYGVGAVGVTWLLARRLVGNVGGVLAAMVLPATSIVVAYGQLVRTDTAGMFFALVALWLALRAMEVGRCRDWVLVAVAIGLAISTRYFYVTLVVPYGVAAWLWLRSSPARPRLRYRLTRAWPVPLVALVATPAAFLATSPFVLLDLRRVIADLRFEIRTTHAGADGLSPLGNLGWYLGHVVPATFGPGLLLLAILGAVLVARHHGRATAVLVAFGASYLVGVSASPLHWDRYVIPLAPLVGIAAAGAVLWIATAVVTVPGWLAGRRRAQSSPGTIDRAPPGPLVVGLAAAIVVVLLVPSLRAVAAADRLRAMPSTRVVATEWILANLAPGSRIAEEMYTAYLDGTDTDVLRVSSLSDRSLEAYRAGGYAYLVWSSAMADRFQDATRYPRESAFYASVEATGRLLALFEPGPDRGGPRIRVYEIAAPVPPG